MSSGVSGVSGAGGVGGASSGGASGGTSQVNAAPGASSVGKGKGATVTKGDGNVGGNSQTQNTTHNEFNNYGMSTQDFCSMRSMGSSNETQSAMQVGEMDVEGLQKMMMAMVIMKILEAFMNNSDGGGAAPAGGGASGAM